MDIIHHILVMQHVMDIHSFNLTVSLKSDSITKPLYAHCDTSIYLDCITINP